MKLYKTIPFALILLLCLSLSNVTLAADKMTYEQYMIERQNAQTRERKANAEMDKIRANIAKMKAEIAALDAEIAALWDKAYADAGTTRKKVNSLNGRVDNLEAETDALSRKSPSELFEQMGDLDQLMMRVKTAQETPAACFLPPRERLNQLVVRLERMKAKAAPPARPKDDYYSVARGDHLWKIAGKKDIFGNSLQWPRLWSANRTDINNPDLIFPKQQLRIPRYIGRDQHLVVLGDYLSKVAGLPEVYGDPFQWRKIYQANKSGSNYMQDPNLIYPEQILDIPRN